jgi:hypothetical protein
MVQEMGSVRVTSEGLCMRRMCSSCMSVIRMDYEPPGYLKVWTKSTGPVSSELRSIAAGEVEFHSRSLRP